MGKDTSKPLNIFAPAKINLFLHITGKLSNGYHNLDSLVAFADIGDMVAIEYAPSFSFHVNGDFADEFNQDDRSMLLKGNNLVVKSARALSQISDNPLNVKITLTKNLPIASGIGGGSSDAAATLWGLQTLWKLAHDTNYIRPLMTKLGADIPVCLHCRPALMRGIGDVLLPAPVMPEIPILLINPMISCSTEDIFLHHNKIYKKEITLPTQFRTPLHLATILKTLDNDLYNPALKLVPEIENVINAIKIHKSCLFTRMSGSGATCFGLFDNIKDAEETALNIRKDNPDWWIKTGWLNRPERY